VAERGNGDNVMRNANVTVSRDDSALKVMRFLLFLLSQYLEEYKGVRSKQQQRLKTHMAHFLRFQRSRLKGENIHYMSSKEKNGDG
jgi:hypothetical protein